MAYKVPMPSDAELTRMAKEALGIVRADAIRADHREALGVTKVATAGTAATKPQVVKPPTAKVPTVQAPIAQRKVSTVTPYVATRKEADRQIKAAADETYIQLSVQIANALRKGNVAEAMRLEALRGMIKFDYYFNIDSLTW